MSANNSPLKGVKGSKWNNIGVVEDKKPDDPSQRRRVSTLFFTFSMTIRYFEEIYPIVPSYTRRRRGKRSK